MFTPGRVECLYREVLYFKIGECQEKKILEVGNFPGVSRARRLPVY